MAKFEESLQRLEAIIGELEKGDVSLDRALELFDEGMKLSGSCRKELEDAEGKVEILLKRDGKTPARSLRTRGPTWRQWKIVARRYPSRLRHRAL